MFVNGTPGVSCVHYLLNDHGGFLFCWPWNPPCPRFLTLLTRNLTQPMTTKWTGVRPPDLSRFFLFSGCNVKSVSRDSYKSIFIQESASWLLIDWHQGIGNHHVDLGRSSHIRSTALHRNVLFHLRHPCIVCDVDNLWKIATRLSVAYLFSENQHQNKNKTCEFNHGLTYHGRHHAQSRYWKVTIKKYPLEAETGTGTSERNLLILLHPGSR